MRLSSLPRRLPESVWSICEPILPPVVGCDHGRPPASNHACRHSQLYVLITGIGWDYVPPCFPCGKTIKAQLDQWLALDAFRTAWQRLAKRYEERHGINWDKVLLDGSNKPSKKGGP